MNSNSILFINSGKLPMPPVSGGAVQQVLYNIAKGLVEQNYKVGVLTFQTNDSRIQEDKCIDWYHLEKEVGSGSIKDIIKSVKLIKNSLRNIPSSKYQTVVIFDPYMAPILKSWNKDVRIIWSVHNTRRKSAFFIKYWTKNVDMVISVSEFLKKSIDSVISKGIQNFVIYNPLPDSFLEEKDNKMNFKKRNTILFCGRLVEEKGLHILIQALEKLPDQIKREINLGIAGATHFLGSNENDYTRRLKTLLDMSKIKYEMLGYIDNEKLIDVYDMYEILVVPSNWDEPATLVAAEGQARNCILVATNAGGLPEMVAPQFKELIANKGDVISLRNSISRALEIANNNENQLNSVRYWLRENLSIETRINRWIEVLNRR